MRVRLRFTKAGKIRFVSHRDVARIMERAMRRLKLPLAYTEGFSPRPKLSFGLALSVGHESWGEYLDVELVDPEGVVQLETLPAQLSEVLPNGMDVTAAAAVQKSDGSLQQLVESCEWRIELGKMSADDVRSALDSILEADSLEIERERKGKRATVDVRAAIKWAEVAGSTDRGVLVTAELATAPLAIRPDEFIGLIGSEVETLAVTRCHQWMIADGTRCEPLAPAGTAERPGCDQTENRRPDPAEERLAS